jgi:hypothetical protein
MVRNTNQAASETADLLAKIARCRRLADEIVDTSTVQKLLALAAEYERQLRLDIASEGMVKTTQE